jgi:general secretion pathway protein G
VKNKFLADSVERISSAYSVERRAYRLSAKRYPLNAKHGFTIIELIVVMTIILILAGLMTGVAQKAKERAMIAQARTMIAGLETALGMFQADMGGYPASGSNNLATALSGNPPGAGTYVVGTQTLNVNANSNYAGPYITFKQGERIPPMGDIGDPWGRAYSYINPGTAHAGGPDYTGYIDISSSGPDGTFSNADDVSNWTR